MDLPLRCSCGAWRGVLREVTPGSDNRVVCYCDDCQSIAHSLGRAPEILDAYRDSKDWDAYAAAFAELLRARNMPATVAVMTEGASRPCLLCACRTADECHRRLIAEAVQARRPGLRVEHLP